MLWARWFTLNVTSDLLLRLRNNNNNRPLEPHTHFRNALAGRNSTTANLKELMRLLCIEPSNRQWFAEMADLVVDNRNWSAHFYQGFGLSDAVQDVMKIFERHPSMADDVMFAYCKSILEKYSAFAPSFGSMFDWQGKASSRA